MLKLSRIGMTARMARHLPTLTRLAWRLLRDKRVPLKHRAVLAASAGYVALPIDLSPDFLPALGRVDDLLVLGAGLGWILRFAPEEVVSEHLEEMGLTRAELEDKLVGVAASFVR